jgi:hypothetical protein
MIRKLSIVVLALSMSAASAYAMAPMKSHHMMHRGMAMCAEGQTKGPCMCGSHNMAMKTKPQMCKAGMWCHTMNGACTM